MSDVIPQMTGPHFFVSADGEIYGENTPENQAIVRRIQACVLACDGISTEELEDGIIADLRKALDLAAPLLEQRQGWLDQVAPLLKEIRTAKTA